MDLRVCLLLTNRGLLFHLHIRGPTLPAAVDNLGLKVLNEKQVDVVSASLILWTFFTGYSSTIAARVGYRAPVVFQGLFSTCWTVFFLLSFIHFSPSTSEGRGHENNKFPFFYPGLSSVCCRKERQPWNFSSLLCQFFRLTGEREAEEMCCTGVLLA